MSTYKHENYLVWSMMTRLTPRCSRSIFAVLGLQAAFCLAINSLCAQQPSQLKQSDAASIEFWYGDKQHFGTLGHPQRWVNLLGHVSPSEQLESLSYSLNDGALVPLSFHEDRKRIAEDGDFNVEVLRSKLRAGGNTVRVLAQLSDGEIVQRTATMTYVTSHKNWTLPYSIDWKQVERIEEVAQVVDGKWELTESGVRSRERYYDRVIAFGDDSWRDYEVTTSITVHELTAPRALPNTTGVTHAAIALRWPGHDADGRQPSVKWHPLGATAEFRLGSDLSQCRWRIFDGKRDFYVESQRRRRLTFDTPYAMKHRVETLDDGRSRYRVKLWPLDGEEPSEWDLERIESDDLSSGSALLIAHHADVTFGNVTVVPIRSKP